MSSQTSRKLQLSHRPGFTLIELLVVIAIIAILIALIMPAVQQAREAARRMQNRNNLKQIGIALHNYHGTADMFPPGWVGVTGTRPDVEGRSGFGWGTFILPMLEQRPLYQRIDFSGSILSVSNSIARSTYLPLFRNPSDSAPNFWRIRDESTGVVLASLPTANYAGCFGNGGLDDCEGLAAGRTCRGNGIFYHNSSTRFRDITDGTSNTFLVGGRRTRLDRNPEWHTTWVGVVPGGQEAIARVLGVAEHNPGSPLTHQDDFSSPHIGGVAFLFGDGRVRFISKNINHGVFQGLATRSGNEPTGEF